MQHIIVVASQKGGVGKTPTSVNLGFALARRPGTRVLLVDMDPQASLTEYLVAEETYEQEETVYNAIMDIKAIDPIEIHPTLHLLNAHDQLFEAEYKLLTKSNPDGRLKAVLTQYDHDYVVIDTPPNLGLLTRNALGAAHQVLIPVRPELIAYRTLKRLRDTLNDVTKSGLNTGLKIWWILPSVVDLRTKHHQEILEGLKMEYKELIYPEPSKATTKYNDAVVEKSDISVLDAELGKYWDRVAATHPAIKGREVVA